MIYFVLIYLKHLLFYQLLPIKKPVASAAFWLAVSEAAFNASIIDFLGLPIFLANDENQ